MVEGSLLTGKYLLWRSRQALLSEVGGARGGIEQGGRTSKHLPCTEASMKSGETLALSLRAAVCNCLALWIYECVVVVSSVAEGVQIRATVVVVVFRIGYTLLEVQRCQRPLARVVVLGTSRHTHIAA